MGWKAGEAQRPVPLPEWSGLRASDSVDEIAWSPDSTALACDVTSEDGSKWILRYSFKPRSYERLAAPGSLARWLGDSRRILYTDRASLRLLDIGTKKSIEILTLGGSSLLGEVALAPDGKQIYMNVEAPEADLWLMSLD